MSGGWSTLTRRVDAYPRKHITVRSYPDYPEIAADVYIGGWRTGRYKTANGVRNAIARAIDTDGNVLARQGVDRCSCGVKYWANDCCTDCGTDVVAARIANRRPA